SGSPYRLSPGSRRRARWVAAIKSARESSRLKAAAILAAVPARRPLVGCSRRWRRGLLRSRSLTLAKLPVVASRMARRGSRVAQMGALELDKLTWPQVRSEIESGRDTVVLALGATEQHGYHLPLATDALLGDHLARALADRLDAFLGPTLRVGCSEHHLGFAGTLSLSESTFHAVVADLVRSLLSGGFRRIVLVPTHGGNFAQLATAVAKLDQPRAVTALTDLGVLFQIAQMGEREYGVPLAEGGLHAG